LKEMIIARRLERTNDRPVISIYIYFLPYLTLPLPITPSPTTTVLFSLTKTHVHEIRKNGGQQTTFRRIGVFRVPTRAQTGGEIYTKGCFVLCSRLFMLEGGRKTIVYCLLHIVYCLLALFRCYIYHTRVILPGKSYFLSVGT
jgi:hypothetical protein